MSEPPRVPPTSNEPRRPGAVPVVYHCDRCGAAMQDVHCKLICPRCGMMRDCSDP